MMESTGTITDILKLSFGGFSFYIIAVAAATIANASPSNKKILNGIARLLLMTALFLGLAVVYMILTL